MQLPRANKGLLGSIVLAVLVVVVPLLVYVVVIQSSQQAYFEGRNHRVLASVAEEMRGYADTLPYIKRIWAYRGVPEFLRTYHRERDLAALRAVPAFRRLSITDEPEQCRKNTEETGGPIEIFERGREALIGRRWCVHADDYKPDDRPHVLRSVLVRLDDAVATSTWEDAFDGVLLADSQGEVIWQAPGTFPRFRRIAEFGPAEAVEVRDGKAVPAAHRLPPASDSRVIDVGDGPVRLFYYPAQIGDSPEQRHNDWVLVGFVSERRFAADVRRPSPLVLAVALGILLVGMVSWPFFKLWTVGPGQHLSRVETLGVGIALLVNSGLLALLVVGGHLHRGAGEHLDGVARTLATNLRLDFSREIGEALDCAEQLARLGPGGAGGCGPGAFESIQGEERAGWRHVRDWVWSAGPGPTPYPPLELAFTVDATGKKWPRQWISRVLPQAHVEMKDRAYFRRVRDGTLWQHGNPPWRQRVFTLERIRARNQGVVLSALAIPVPAQPDAEEAVLVIAKRFHSLWNAILPPGFRFAVVENETGLVLYHSDDEKSRVENFYAESGTGEALRGAALLGDERALQGRYHGVRHRYWVEPLDPMPWSLVILRNRDLLDEVTFDVFITCVAHLATAAVALALVLLLMHAMRPGGLNLSWLAPQERLQKRYGFVAVLLGALAIGCVSAIHQVTGPALLVFPVLLPLVVFPLLALANRAPSAPRRRFAALESILGGALLLLAVLFSQSLEGAEAVLPPLIALLFLMGVLSVAHVPVGPRRHAQVPPQVLWRYRVVVVLVLATVGALPSLAVLKDALGRAQELVAHHSEAEYARALGARDARLRADAERLQPFPFGEPGVPARVALPASWPLVWPAMPGLRLDAAAHEHGRANGRCDGSLWPKFGTGVLADLIQPYGGHAGRVRRAACAQASAGGRRVTMTPAPTLRWPRWSPGVWATFGLLAVAVMAGMWLTVLELTRAIFAVDVRDPARGAEALTSRDLASANRILLNPPESWLGARLPVLEWAFGPKGMLELDALADPDWPSREDVRPEALRDLRFVVVKNADLVLHSPVRRGRLLRILEFLVTHGDVGVPHVLLVCRRAPERLVLAPDQEGAGGAPRVRPEERERWRRVLAEFAQGPAFEQVLPDWRSEGSEETRVLARECAWWEALEPIRMEMARELRSRAATGRLEDARAVDGFVVRQVAQRASYLYRGLWGLCNPEERAVLGQLAQGQLVSPASHGALESLMARGLVKRDPDIRPVCRSFAEFVLAQPSEEEVRVWQKTQADHAAWGWIRLPLAAGLAVVAGYFLWSGRGDVLTAQLGVVSAVIAGAAPLLRLLFGSGVPQVPGESG